MLREKERQGNTTQQKDKATQHNSPKAVSFQRKNCFGWDSYQLSYYHVYVSSNSMWVLTFPLSQLHVGELILFAKDALHSPSTYHS